MATKKAKDNLSLHLVGGRDARIRYEGSRIKLSSINILPQPRVTFEIEPLRALATNIARFGFINPPLIGIFTQKNCAAYLLVINSTHGTSYKMKELKPIKGIYYILIAGERRYKACRLLWEEGCEDCREEAEQKGKPLKTGECFRRHFRGDRIEVRICKNIPPFEALLRQCAENTYVPVPAHEEADAYAKLYRVMKECHPEITLAEFARGVGRSAETVRKALKYFSLPTFIRKSVEKRRIPYGSAVELARLQEEGVSEEDLRGWVDWIIVEQMKVNEVRVEVIKYIEGRLFVGDLFDDLLEKDRGDVDNKRLVVGQRVLRSVYCHVGYLLEVLRLVDEGKIPNPFSEGSPVRVYRRLAELMGRANEKLAEFLPRKALAHSKEVSLEGERAAGLVLQIIEKSGSGPKKELLLTGAK